MVIILNFLIFKLSDIDQGIYKHPIQMKMGIFSVFEEKKLSQKKIKANIIVTRTTLCTQKKINFACKNFFFEQCLFAYEIRFAVEKKTKSFWARFSKLLKNFLCRHQKNASYIISIYGNRMISITFKKRKPRFFLPDCFIRIKQPQK